MKRLAFKLDRPELESAQGQLIEENVCRRDLQ